MAKKDYSGLCRKRRREKGLCPQCSKKIDRDGYYCSECLVKNREYIRENKKFYRDNNLCNICGKERLFGQEKRCITCRQKNYELQKSITEEQRIKHNIYLRKHQKQLYQERSEQGICTRCGKRKANPGRKKCGICLDKNAEQKRKKSFCKQDEKERRKENNLCYRCGEPLDVDKSKLCSKCYDAACKNLEKARAVSPIHKYWKEQKG